MTIYRPDLNQFRELAQTADLVPVVREFAADLETPVSVYVKLMEQSRPSFLLESVVRGEHFGRYSFVGLNPKAVVSLRGKTVTTTDYQGETTSLELADDEDILDILRQHVGSVNAAPIEGLPRFIGGAVGYLSYDTVRFYEELPETAEDVLGLPEAVFMITDTLVVFDHIRNRLLIMANAHIGDDIEASYVSAIQRIEEVAEVLLRPLPAIPRTLWSANGKPNRALVSNKTQAEYEQMVRDGKEYIAKGDAFQIVLSQRFQRETDAHPFAIYRALRMLNPSPYMFYFNFPEDGFQVVGASPEVQVRLEDGTAMVRPIAGTRPRGKTNAEDDFYEKELLEDPKEVAEHLMLIDLGRNDIGRVSDYGTVTVPDQFVVEKYSHVMHIVSSVEGKIRDGMDAFDLMRATFPAGTLSGAPKVRAMQIIEKLEGERRSLYGGAVGYFGYDGSMDTCIAIRTLVMRGNTLTIQAGAGIVADSDPATEYEECFNKANALMTAIDRAESGDL